jgi:hypothetical protein
MRAMLKTGEMRRKWYDETAHALPFVCKTMKTLQKKAEKISKSSRFLK